MNLDVLLLCDFVRRAGYVGLTCSSFHLPENEVLLDHQIRRHQRCPWRSGQVFVPRQFSPAHCEDSTSIKLRKDTCYILVKIYFHFLVELKTTHLGLVTVKIQTFRFSLVQLLSFTVSCSIFLQRVPKLRENTTANVVSLLFVKNTVNNEKCIICYSYPQL